MTELAPQNAARPADSASILAPPFYQAVWRWHFYAGLFVAPFLVMLAVTGLVMMFIAVIDGRDGEKIAVSPVGDRLSVTAQADAALAARSGALIEFIGPAAPDRASVFRISAAGDHHMVAVDPYSGAVLESWARRDGWYDLMTDIHGTLLIGDTGDRLIEIAASFGVMLIVSGVFLWWPRGAALRAALVPDLSARGRALWKTLHVSIGFYTAVLLLGFLLTGLAWAGIWGGKFTQAWSTFPAEKWDSVPLSDVTHAEAMNSGATKDAPWALEQTPMPASGGSAGAPGVEGGGPFDADRLYAFGAERGFEGRYRVHYPQGETGVWTLSSDSMSNDSTDPTSDRTVHIDQYTGKILADVRFADYPAAGKAMAVGIAFHEGDMGLWNIVLNTVFCLAIVFLSIGGVVMWWMRRPAKAGRLVAPTMPAGLPLWTGAVFTMLALSLLFPLMGVALIILLACDLFILRHIPRLRRAFQ